MSFLSKLFGKVPKSDSADPRSDISQFRDRVIAEAKKLGCTLDFKLDPNDPGHVTFLRDGEFSGEANFHNAFGHLQAYQEEDIDEVISNLAKTVLASEEDSDTLEMDDIVVVIRPEEYIQAVNAQNDDIIAEPLFGELYAFYMVDTPHAMRGLLASELENLAELNLKDIALSNVRNHLDDLNADHSLEATSLYYVEGNTFLTSSLILLDEFWERIETKYQEDCLFVLPRKDQLFVFDTNHPEAIKLAQHMVRITFEDDFNLLSSQVFSRKNGVIELASG